MVEIENFDKKIDVIRNELEKFYSKVSYIKSESNISRRHIYNCDDEIIMVDNYKRVYKIIGQNKKIPLPLKIDV